MMAVLGPTNTGKTHFAVERMLSHRSGLMGFPLRLLAREIYDRIVALKGPRAVQLLTGEERLGPKDAPFTVSTVEAMPLERRFAFLAVDEIQLCADDERGHVFTDRLLHARGTEETLFLGSDVIRPLLKKLIPEAEVVTRPRLSTLAYAGEAKLTRLPRRTAVVAFSAADVYQLGEVVRRQRGGAAIVLGALSPRTRNAQVELYQSGEVDYLIATDAVGMGLNMDVGHVAFAGLEKFDGRRRRKLLPREVAQIAGRAGRHLRDGTFGTTAGLGPLAEELIEAVEGHQFAPLEQIRWRNGELDFRSVAQLMASLDREPQLRCLVRTRDALDHRCLSLMARREEVRRVATDRSAVELLWQVCQIPDYRKTLTEAHLHLLGQVYQHLLVGDGVLPGPWVAQMVTRLERTDGDIDALVARIAHIRTWTYLSHRHAWLDDAAHWQERTRAVEDKLSDALHERLTQRFVDRRTAALLKRLHAEGELFASVAKDGGVEVDGHPVGRLEGLSFAVAATDAEAERRAVAMAARRVVGPALKQRVRALVEAGDDAFLLDDEGRVIWEGAVVARLVAGTGLLKPGVRPVLDESIVNGTALAVRERLEAFVVADLARRLAPLPELAALQNAGAASASLRGLAFHLLEGLGTADVGEAGGLVERLEPESRRRLQRLGIRFGVHALFAPKLLRADALALRRLLWRLAHPNQVLPAPGQSSVKRDGQVSAAAYRAIGYRLLGGHALRVDIAERLSHALRQGTRDGASFQPGPELGGLTGLGRHDLDRVIQDFGYRRCKRHAADDAAPHFRRAQRRTARGKRERANAAGSGNGAFAVLAQLRTGSLN
ncbi:MAG: disulfide oxidoreductase [Geminicoccaceae bacterium]|nr:MAG: disulfide oxidoreductase [Geminicoccaceae bacterium]